MTNKKAKWRRLFLEPTGLLLVTMFIGLILYYQNGVNVYNFSIIKYATFDVSKPLNLKVNNCQIVFGNLELKIKNNIEIRSVFKRSSIFEKTIESFAIKSNTILIQQNRYLEKCQIKIGIDSLTVKIFDLNINCKNECSVSNQLPKDAFVINKLLAQGNKINLNLDQLTINNLSVLGAGVSLNSKSDQKSNVLVLANDININYQFEGQTSVTKFKSFHLQFNDIFAAGSKSQIEIPNPKSQNDLIDSSEFPDLGPKVSKYIEFVSNKKSPIFYDTQYRSDESIQFDSVGSLPTVNLIGKNINVNVQLKPGPKMANIKDQNSVGVKLYDILITEIENFQDALNQQFIDSQPVFIVKYSNFLNSDNEEIRIAFFFQNYAYFYLQNFINRFGLFFSAKIPTSRLDFFAPFSPREITLESKVKAIGSDLRASVSMVNDYFKKQRLANLQNLSINFKILNFSAEM